MCWLFVIVTAGRVWLTNSKLKIFHYKELKRFRNLSSLVLIFSDIQSQIKIITVVIPSLKSNYTRQSHPSNLDIFNEGLILFKLEGKLRWILLLLFTK